MNLAALSSTIPFALDAAILALLGVLLWRLGRDPERAWRTREERLTAIVGDLRLLVAQAEGQARDLDDKLAAHQESVRASMRSTSEHWTRDSGGRPAARRGVEPQRGLEPPQPAGASGVGRHPTDERAAILDRVRKLVEARVPVEDIAQRLAVPLAEVRVLAGLAGERRPDPAERASSPSAAMARPRMRPGASTPAAG